MHVFILQCKLEHLLCTKKNIDVPNTYSSIVRSKLLIHYVLHASVYRDYYDAAVKLQVNRWDAFFYNYAKTLTRLLGNIYNLNEYG